MASTKLKAGIFSAVVVAGVVTPLLLLRQPQSRPSARSAPGPNPVIVDHTPRELRNVGSRLWTATFSPDGQTLAVTAGWDNPPEPGELVLWDVPTRQPKLIWRQEATIRCAAFSGNGKKLAIGDFAGMIRILEPRTGKTLLTLPRHGHLVNSLTFTPENSALVTGSFDQTIKVWDAINGKLQATLVVPLEGIVRVAVSPDGRLLAAVTWPGKAHVWELGTQRELHVFEANPQGRPAEAVAFSQDSRSLITGGGDASLKLWDVAGGTMVRELAGHGAGVLNAVFSPDGGLLASSDGAGAVRLWKPATGECVAVLNAHSNSCFGLAFSPDGKQLATASWDKSVGIWDVETRQPIATLVRERN